MKILIVDDAMAARMMLKNCIPAEDNHEIEEASDGSQGLEKFKSFKPDLTFLDLTMPVMDGFETLEKIKQLDPAAIVVVLTADIQKKSIEKVEALGAYTVLKKLPTAEVIQKTINEVREKTGK